MGAEISADGTIGKNLTWRANYTFTDTNQELPPIDIQSLSPRDTTARHKANVELGYQRDRWFATSVLRYRSATHQFGVNTIGDIALFAVSQAFAWDQKVGFDAGRATFTLTGENLTAARGAGGSAIPADRRILVGVKLGL
jgi:iron complex outermembrane receptor protein